MKKIVTALVISTGLLLAGCSSVGSAASVGSTQIKQSVIQSGIDTLLAERKKVDTSQMQLATGEELNRSQVRFFILSAIFEAIAKELKLTVSATELATKKNEIITQVGGAAALPKSLVGATIVPQDLDRYLTLIIISTKIGKSLLASGVADKDINTKITQMLIAKSKELKVTVNPRYGKWDPATGNIIAANPAGAAVTPSTK